MTAEHYTPHTLDLDRGLAPEKEIFTKFFHCLDFDQVQEILCWGKMFN
jgi:hypothetical protein